MAIRPDQIAVAPRPRGNEFSRGPGGAQAGIRGFPHGAARARKSFAERKDL